MRILWIFLLAAKAWAQNFTVIAGEGDDRLNQPYGLGIGPDKALYFCEIGNHRISRLDLATGKLSIAVGTGQRGNAGDGGPATEALVDQPYELAFSRAGDLYFCDQAAHVIRRVDRQTHVISTVAGTGIAGYSGDGGPAVRAQLRQPHSIAFTPSGLLLICDILNFRIRSLDTITGMIETWAGTGKAGRTPDGAPLTETPLDGPRAIAVDRSGGYYLALREGNAVFRMDLAGRKLYRFAGAGEQGYSGDGGPARSARLAGPKGVALSPDGSLYIADTENHAIRRVDRSGVISTVAGDGQRGDGARLARPHGVFVDQSGAVYIADSENNRILRLR